MKPKPFPNNAVRSPVFWGAAFAAACGLAVTIGVLQSRGAQGELPPTAPTVAEWAALPADAPLTYRVTEIKIGNPRTDRLLTLEPAAINNNGQIVGKMERVPALVPFWWRRIYDAPFLGRAFGRPPFGEAAFVWDGATGRVQTLPIPSGALATHAYDINDRGQIVGAMDLPPRNPRTDPSITHALYWSDASAVPQDIGASLAPLESDAFGINASGQARVRASGMAPNPPGMGGTHFIQPIYLWEHNTLKPTASEGWAVRINDKGESVGCTFNATSKASPPETLFRIVPNHTVDPLTELNQKLRSPDAVVFCGNSGQIAGTDKDGPFVYAHGKLTRFLLRATPSASRAMVQAMNRSDDVIGYDATSFSGKNNAPVFLWRKNHLRDLNKLLGKTPRWKILSANGINDRGQIVGFAQPVDSARRITQPSGRVYDHVVLLTPVLPPALK